MFRFRCLEYGHMIKEAQDASDLAKKRQNGCGSTQSGLKIMDYTCNLAKTGRILCVNTVQTQHDGGGSRFLELGKDRVRLVDPLRFTSA